MEDNILDSLKWEGNSKNMYAVICKAVPDILKSGVQRLVTSWIIQNNVKVVTEDIVFQVVDEIAPSDAANKLKPVLMQMRTAE